jgi:hypothetical protein
MTKTKAPIPLSIRSRISEFIIKEIAISREAA